MSPGSISIHLSFAYFLMSSLHHSLANAKLCPRVLFLFVLYFKRENKGNAVVGYTSLESIKTLLFAIITNVIGSTVN